MLEDILEESWTYQEIIKKGMQKGLDLGREKGREEGREEERQQRVQEQRQTLVNLVQMRFPELVPLAEQQVAFIKDTELLHSLIAKLFAVQTADETRQALMEAGTEDK